MSMYISIDFCRLRVIRTTFKHITSDLETFLGSAKLDAMRETLQGHANKINNYKGFLKETGLGVS